jgi:hypothetical protein
MLQVAVPLAIGIGENRDAVRSVDSPPLQGPRQRPLPAALSGSLNKAPGFAGGYLHVLKDIEANPVSTATDVRRRLQKPRATVDRTLQALHILELLKCDEDVIKDEGGKAISRWFYRLDDGVKVRDVLGISWRGGR